MILRVFIVILSFILLPSCNSNKIHFGLDKSYMLLNENEQEAMKDKKTVEIYSKKFNKWPTLQIPLNKVIKSPEYILYIGVGLNVNQTKYIDTLFNDTTFKIIEKREEEEDVLTLFYKKDDHYGYQIIFPKTYTKYLTVFNYVSKDSLKTNYLFNSYGNIKEKIHF